MDNIELNRKEKIRKKDKERTFIQRNDETPEVRAVRLQKRRLSYKKRKMHKAGIDESESNQKRKVCQQTDKKCLYNHHGCINEAEILEYVKDVRPIPISVDDYIVFGTY